MASTRELRRRIKSVKNTSQITKAMQMVAATKMKKAQNQALGGRPYNLRLNFALSKLLSKVDATSHPLLQQNDSKKVGVILLTTDKSLCGALNTNIFRFTSQFLKEKSDVIFYTLGKKGRQFIARSGLNLVADFENTDIITFRQAARLAKLALDSFLTKEVSEVYIIYPDFVSTLTQNPVKIKLFPIAYSEIKELVADEDKKNAGNELEFLFEPSTQSLLDFLLKHFVEEKVYQAMLETKASEHSARMIAMKNATDNAVELIDDLTLTMNQVRQGAITKEILEISSASAAMQ